MARKKEDDSHLILSNTHFKLQEICDILDEVIDTFDADEDSLSYTKLLNNKKLYRSKMQHWIDSYPNSVGARISVLRDIREARLEEALTTAKGANDKKIPPAQLIFRAKTCGMIEEESARRIEASKKESGQKLNMDENITIGFEEEEEQDD